MIRAALNGSLEKIPTRVDPYFGLSIPAQVPDVPDEVLDPIQTWADREAYNRQVRILVAQFQENFTQFAGQVPRQVVDSGPAIV
jgi:phosphoenolpyruvate carboxykinase (ATP)